MENRGFEPPTFPISMGCSAFELIPHFSCILSDIFYFCNSLVLLNKFT